MVLRCYAEKRGYYRRIFEVQGIAPLSENASYCSRTDARDISDEDSIAVRESRDVCLKKAGNNW